MILAEEDKARAATKAGTDFPDNMFAVTISNNCLSEKLCSVRRASAAAVYLSLFLCPLSLTDLSIFTRLYILLGCHVTHITHSASSAMNVFQVILNACFLAK